MKNNSFKSKKEGFTIIELLLVLGLIVIATSIVFSDLKIFKTETGLEGEASEIVNVLKLAQNKTLSSEGASAFGVYFNTSTAPMEYTLFKGGSFALRNPSFDERHTLSNQIEIYDLVLGAGNAIVFQRLTGYASSTLSFESVSMRLIANPSETKTIYVEKSGLIGTSVSDPLAESGRMSDSRHIHFNYNRTISTSTDKVILTFAYDSSQVVREIAFADNMVGGQFFWEGEISVDGSLQKIKIHTHKFNDADTQFCIHRDARYNSKALKVDLFDDGTGSLIEYTALSQEARGSSVFLTLGDDGNPKRQ